MEASVELVTTGSIASASLTQNPNPEVCKNSTKSKEEGELSSSGGDEPVAASVAQIDSSLNKSPKDLESGRCVSTSNPKEFTNISSATTQQNLRKITERSRTPFVPFVISFSDEDSDSDSEECMQSNVPETRGNVLALNRNGVPPSGRKWQRLGQTTRSRARVLPGKLSLSRTFVSSMAKLNGPNARNGGRSMAEQRSQSHAGNFRTFNRRSVVQQHGAKQNMQNNRFDSSKLQDLRQQIAIREKELKLKSLQQRYETVSGSCKDHNITGSESDATRKRRASSAEPDKKRLKHIEAHPIQLISDSEQQMQSVHSVVLSRKSLQDNDGHQGLNNDSHRDSDMPLGTTDTVVSQHQKKENTRPPQYLGSRSANKEDGVDVVISGSQSDRNAKLVNPCISSQKTGRESRSKGIIDSGSAGLKPSSEINSHSTQLSNKATSSHHLATAGEFHEERSKEKAYDPRSKTHNACSLHVPDSNLETSNVPHNNPSLGNCFGMISISGNNNMDMQSLIEMEELEDKELEHAQAHRHKCEVDERNALKAYRNAQRALMEANAKCSYLYRKRELHSAQLRNLMMENPSLFWSSSLHNSAEAGLNSSYYISDENEDQLPASDHQMQTDLNVYDQQGYDSNPQAVDGALQTVGDQQVYRQLVTSNHCSEPDASTSEPCKDRMVEDRVYSPSNDLDGSEEDDGDNEDDEDGFDNKSMHSDFGCQTKENDLDYGEQEDLNDQDIRKSCVDYHEESLLLEATLRSQLVARLGAKTSSRKKVSVQNAESNDASRAEHDGTTRQADGDVLFSDEKSQHYAIGGTSEAETCVTELPVQTDLGGHVETFSSNYQSPMVDCLESYNSSEDNQSSRSITSPCPIIRSTFGHTKVSEAISLAGLQSRSQQIQNHDINRIEDYGIGSPETEQMDFSTCAFYDVLKKTSAENTGCYTCDFVIDPLWPLCMFELRGRCNDDECLFQHVRDYSCKKMNIQNTDNTDCQIVSSSKKGKPCMGLDLVPPTYLVCSDVLKADLRPFGSILTRGVGQCWQKCFSTSLVLSSLLPSDFLTDGPFLHGTEARIEIHGNWNSQSYFHSRYCKGKLDQQLADSDQKLEMALLNLNQEADKRKGRIEALKVLSRGLEANPSSLILWLPYLLIYYSSEMSVQKDDLFLYAVEHNEDSYELWLMFINSRIELENRLVAYESALVALCRHASTVNSGPVHASACILDLFLQFMNCLCKSGNIDRAIGKIQELIIPSGGKSEESLPCLLSDIPQCLSLYDKCVFWLCCVYIVVYKKVPDGIVQQFEFEKELSEIEWPCVCLTVDDKQKAVTLMEMAVDSLALYIDCRPLEGESSTLKVAHMFALNHVKFISVLEGLECSRNLLDKYTAIYPSCLELVLMSARGASSDDLGDLSFSGFEEALRNWPEEVPGVQCIWNQYAEHALQNGRFDFVKELMNRWFCCVWEEQVNSMGGETSENDGGIDAVFGLLNLALHKSLQNNLVDARSAIDRALRTATGKDYYEVCVREHASFVLATDPPADGALSILRNYSVDALTLPVCEPLTRKFLERIKKPRVRQLASNLLCSASTCDFSEVNLVLEVCYGPSLLPGSFDSVKDLVDMVETVMEMYPSNYRLAMSACKVLISRSPNPARVSFWGSSVLVNALFRAVPVAAEHVWVEAAAILQTLTDINSITENFHRRALSMDPYSMKLWNSYLNLCRVTKTTTTCSVIEAARGRGIKLD